MVFPTSVHMRWCLILVCTNLLFYPYQYVSAQSPTYTEMEKNALIKFRELVKKDIYQDYMKSDLYLIRWLRARNFDQNEARRMLQKAIKWRKDYRVDGLPDEEVFDPKSKPFFIDGTDNRGSIIGTILATRFDTRGFIIQGKRDIPVRYFAQALETAEKDIYRRSGIIGNGTITGPDAHLATVIFDMNGYNLRQHACLACFGVYLEWFQILENHYPGYVKHLIFINAPRILGPMIEFIKPLMSKMTRHAFQVFGTNKAEWKREIVGRIAPASELRPQFGGTKAED